MLDQKHITFVFDLDESLIYSGVLNIDSQLYLLRSNGLIRVNGHDHWVQPGAFTLLRYLFSKPNVRVAFFNRSYSQQRSQVVTEALLRMALGDKKFKEVASSVRVLSKIKGFKPSFEDRLDRQARFFSPHDKNELDVKISIEDNASWETAFLVGKNPGWCIRQFIELPRFIYGKYDQALFECPNKNEPASINMSQDFENANVIFYLTGIIKVCLDLFEAGEDVAKCIFNLHYKLRFNQWGKPFFIPKSDLFQSHYYLNGLMALNEFEPGLVFVTRDDCRRFTSINPPNENEIEILTKGGLDFWCCAGIHSSLCDSIKQHINLMKFISSMFPDDDTHLVLNPAESEAKVDLIAHLGVINKIDYSSLHHFILNQEAQTHTSKEPERATQKIPVPSSSVTLFKQLKKQNQEKNRAVYKANKCNQLNKHHEITKSIPKSSQHPRRGNQR